MAAFATIEDVATAARKSFDAEDSATVSYLLDVATQAIQDFTEQTIEAQDDVVVTLRALSGIWIVPEIPVRAVTSVEVDGEDFANYDLDWDAGIFTRTDDSWSTNDVVVITYDSGFTVIPNSIRGVCADMAKRAFENPAGLQRDDLNTASQWLGLTAENEQVLRRYKV